VETLSEALWYVARLQLQYFFDKTCRKISLGDAQSYFITTARNDLGVIFATSEAGEKRYYSRMFSPS
jgi:hypothetical protein